MDTLLLFYKIYQNDVKSIDYIDWSLNMLENDCSSFSLNILSSLIEPHNIFEVDDYFKRALRELGLHEPALLTIIAKEAKTTLGMTGNVKIPSTAKTLKK